METEITGLIIKWVIPFLLGSVVSAITFSGKWFKKANQILKETPEKMDKLNKKIDNNNREIKDLKKITVENDIAILWSQITGKSRKVIEKNHCDIETMECIDQLFKRYKAIGGNHGVEAIVKQVKAICERSE